MVANPLLPWFHQTNLPKNTKHSKSSAWTLDVDESVEEWRSSKCFLRVPHFPSFKTPLNLNHLLQVIFRNFIIFLEYARLFFISNGHSKSCSNDIFAWNLQHVSTFTTLWQLNKPFLFCKMGTSSVVGLCWIYLILSSMLFHIFETHSLFITTKNFPTNMVAFTHRLQKMAKFFRVFFQDGHRCHVASPLNSETQKVAIFLKNPWLAHQHHISP